MTQKTSKLQLIALSALIGGFLLLPQMSLAAKRQILPDYKAEKYSKITEVEMVTGELKKIKVGFYNRGAFNWRRTNKNYISLYTYNPKNRKSVFYNSKWINQKQPAKLKDSLVGPNSLGYFEIYLQAPKKPGVYKESFAIAAENKIWVPGGQFELTITVKERDLTDVDDGSGNTGENFAQDDAPASTGGAPTQPVPTDGVGSVGAPQPTGLEAVRLSKLEPLVLKPNEEKTVSVMYMNAGKPSWKKRALILNNIAIAAEGNATIAFATPAWLNPGQILQFENGEVNPGQTEIYSIPLKAPAANGIYTLHLQLIVDDEPIEGGGLDLPVTVTDDSNFVAPNAGVIVPDNMKEPKIKIGLYSTEDPVEFISESFYKATDASGQNFGIIAAGEKAVISFNEETGLYTLVLPTLTVETTSSIRIVPIQENSIFTLTNYNNRPRWNLDLNDNQFRGGLEMRYAPTGYLWVINNILMEDYLKGLAEANNASPPEFLKALMTAARSYANYHLNNPTKHQAGGFILDSENDQVYRGYGQEKRAPNIAAAVEATRGMIVTYKGEPVVTPFFGRSSGRTLSFKEVWGVNKPWLVSVKAIYDKGRKRWGHGVGMSAQDAIGRAKHGANWDAILKYYYRGTELQKMY